MMHLNLNLCFFPFNIFFQIRAPHNIIGIHLGAPADAKESDSKKKETFLLSLSPSPSIFSLFFLCSFSLPYVSPFLVLISDFYI